MAEPAPSNARSTSSSTPASATSVDLAPPPLPPPPPQNEWEVLSMSMTASAFGPPSTPSITPPAGGLSTEGVPPPPHHDTSFETFGGGGASQRGSGPDGLALSDDAEDRKHAEPFTEGWKPNLSIPTLLAVGHDDTHGYGGDVCRFQGNFPEEVCRVSQQAPEAETITAVRDFTPAEEVYLADFAQKVKEEILPVASSNEVDQSAKGRTHKSLAGLAGNKRTVSRKSKLLWSVATATAVIGFAMLVRQWHHERLENQQLRLELSAKDQELTRLMLGMNRLQKVLHGSV